MHVKTGDDVVILSGNHRGERGKVLRILRESGRVLVEGVNLRVKILRKTQANPQGGTVDFALIYIPNEGIFRTMHLDGESKIFEEAMKKKIVRFRYVEYNVYLNFCLIKVCLLLSRRFIPTKNY